VINTCICSCVVAASRVRRVMPQASTAHGRSTPATSSTASSAARGECVGDCWAGQTLHATQQTRGDDLCTCVSSVCREVNRFQQLMQKRVHQAKATVATGAKSSHERSHTRTHRINGKDTGAAELPAAVAREVERLQGASWRGLLGAMLQQHQWWLVQWLLVP
jgi:hypothetical protein